MYVPPIYKVDDTDWIRFVVKNFPLALLVTNGPEAPAASHLPIVMEDDAEFSVCPVGSSLYGHMDRRNPQWGSLAPEGYAKLIFSGPSSYITPEIYGLEVASPTWDFLSVHVSGVVYPAEGSEATLAVINRTVDALESHLGTNWDPSASLEYFDRMLPGVGAFRFVVEKVETMFKMSQEKSPDLQERVITALQDSQAGAARDLAIIMRAYGLGCASPAFEGESR